MKPEDRCRLEELNTDHHRRMALNHADLQRRNALDAVVAGDTRSRAAIIKAMQGCSARYGIEAPSPRHVLELGAGSGRDIDHLSAIFDATYTGVEVVEHAAAALRERERDVHHVAVEEMPAEWTKRFHFIYSRHVMEHLVDVEEGLSNIARVLAHDGIIGAVTPHFFPDPEPAHVTKLKLEEWVRAYERQGMAVVYGQVLEDVGPTVEAHIVAIHRARLEEV